MNRILGPYLNEAGCLLGDGATVQEVDAAARAFGMPMGPLRLMDEVGIDVSHHAGASLHEALGERLAPARLLGALAETGRLGRKGGSGFYLYENGREKGVDEASTPTWAAPSPTRARRTWAATRSGGGWWCQMINEAARSWRRASSTRAGRVDLAMIMGTGFPPFRGGLLRFADTLHPRGILDRIAGAARAIRPPLRACAPPGGPGENDRRFYEAFGG